MYSLNDAVRDYYEEAVSYLKNHKFFNEDVFQDTVLKCFIAFQHKEVHKENVLRYFLTSYKLNTYTTSKCSKLIHLEETYTNDFEETLYIEEYQGNHFDYMQIRDFLLKRYGKTKALLLKQYNLGGYSIRELEEKSGISNLYYIFKKMTNDVKEYFT